MDCKYFNNCKKAQTGKCIKNSEPFCIKEFRINNLLKNALLSEKQMCEPVLRIDDDNETDTNSYVRLKEIYDNIVTEVSNGKSIYIYSTTTGNGKTSWSLKMLIHYLSSIWYKASNDCYGLFINVPRFLLSLKSYISDKSDSYIPTIQSNVITSDIVVWDDIGTKISTEYERENLLSIINARMDAGKTNIFTGNINPSELSKMLGERLSSRILCCELIGFKGKDLRGKYL